jgi:hypothetical protein
MTNTWDLDSASQHVHQFGGLDGAQQIALVALLNAHFPPAVYEDHVRRRRAALANQDALRSVLSRAVLDAPRVVSAQSVVATPADLCGCGVVFTAGGEGERLRLSLLEQGIPAHELTDFTKATFPLPGFPGNAGALQINLRVIAHLAAQAGCDIPVVVTTGPAGSITARVIPRIIAENRAFGLSSVRVVEQDERLHLTVDDKIAWRLVDDRVELITQPDETGGPLMKLRAPDPALGSSALDWLVARGCSRVLVLQGTAVYDPTLLLRMAAAGRDRDGLGVGISRTSFPADDPYGTFVNVNDGGRTQLMIVEQQWRPDAVRSVREPGSGAFLPFNTGFYAFDVELLRRKGLPDYATSPKEVLPGLPRAPKAGFAATDILPMAENPAVLSIPESWFAVLKNAGDLRVLSELALALGLDRMGVASQPRLEGHINGSLDGADRVLRKHIQVPR